MNSQYKILENGKYTTVPIGTEKQSYIPTNNTKLQDYIRICTANKESIISFILGTINDSESGDIFLSTEDTTGFYNFPSNGITFKSIPKKKNRSNIDRDNLSNLYFRYLKDIRDILGAYFSKDAGTMIYLIVDTTNISFSKYYQELTPLQRSELKLMVLCNTAMSWDGATSAECQKKSSKTGEDQIVHIKNTDNRAIYDLESLTLSDRSDSTFVKFDSKPEIDSQQIPRTVGTLSECIRQQIDKKRKKTKECNIFTTKSRLLDIKRSGDALQALMAKQLNDKNDDLYIFVTLDHLAFLKARLNGIPSIFTSTMKEKNSDIINRVMILFNNTFEKNYKAMGYQLTQEFKKFAIIQKSIEDNFPLAAFKKELADEKEKEAYFRFFLMLDYFTRSLLGVVLFVRPKTPNVDFKQRIRNEDYKGEEFTITEFLKESEVDDNQNIIINNLQVLLQDYVINDSLKEKCKIQFYKPYLQNSLYKTLQNKIRESVEPTIASFNSSINEIKTKLKDIARTNGQEQFTLSETVGLLDTDRIISIFEQFILNTFIIECFYTLKRAGVFVQYFEDVKTLGVDVYGTTIPNLSIILQQEPMNDQESAVRASKYIETLKSMNKKYCMYTKVDDPDELFEIGPLEALAYFFDNYSYSNDNDTEFKMRLKNLFEMNYEQYIEFVDSLLREITVAFDGIMKNNINLYLKKFNDPEYFKEPEKATRGKLRVKEKMAECMNQFNNPNMLQRTYQDLIYNRIHNNAEGFYKSKMAELHLGNLTNKAIPFQKAMAKIISDEVKVRSSELPQQGGDCPCSKSRSQGEDQSEDQSAYASPEIITKRQEVRQANENTEQKTNPIGTIRMGGADSTIFLILYRSILLNNIVYDPDNYDDYPWTQYDLINLDIYKKYNIFLTKIFENYSEYIPIYYEIDKELFKTIWSQETGWNIPYSADDIRQPLVNDKYRLQFGSLLNLWYKIITKLPNIRIDEIENITLSSQNFRDFKMHNFTYDIISDLLRQHVDSLYKIIYDVYTGKINYSSKDNDLRFDMVFWMMINDPALLLYHPYRESTWGAYEKYIIDNAITQNMIYKPEERIVYEGGAPGPARPRDMDMGLPLALPGRKDPLESISREVNQKQRKRPLNSSQTENSKTMIYDVMHNYRNGRVRPRYDAPIRRDPIADQYQHPIKDEHMNTLQVIQDYLPKSDDTYNEYCTLDEYATMKCIFQSIDKYLLRTNLGVLSFLDLDTGLLKDTYGNLYNPSSKLQGHKVVSNENIFIEELGNAMITSGGGFNNRYDNGKGFNGYLTLADYHKKYYNKYYELYYDK